MLLKIMPYLLIATENFRKVSHVMSMPDMPKNIGSSIRCWNNRMVRCL